MHVSNAKRAAVAAAVAAVTLAPAAERAHSFTQRQLSNLVAGSVTTGKPVIFPAAPAPSTDPDQLSSDLISHGGAVLHHPHAYLVFWGSAWASNAAVRAPDGTTYHLNDAIRYLTDFFTGLGGSPWIGVTTQYCDNVMPGTTDCTTDPDADYVHNDPGQLAGVWVDGSSDPPSTIVTSGLAENQVARDPIATEAEAATLHFGYDPEGVYMVYTPPGVIGTGYPGSQQISTPVASVRPGAYCAYHQQASTPARGRTVQYAFMPFVPEAGSGCRDNTVNKTNDAYGHGYFDSYSITAGHEYSEAVTDPGNFFSFQDGWNDAQTSENGDKCVGTGLPLKNITLRVRHRPQYFAVQPTWSNEDFDAGNPDGGCSFG